MRLALRPKKRFVCLRHFVLGQVGAEAKETVERNAYNTYSTSRWQLSDGRIDSYHVTLDIVYVFIGTSSKYIHYLHTFNGDQR